MNKNQRIIGIFLILVLLISNVTIVAADGTTVINTDFEGSAQTVFSDNNVVSLSDTKAYSIKDVQLVNKTANLKNYSVSFDAQIKINESDFLLPSVKFRKTDEDTYYNVYFNSLNSSISLERSLKGEKTPLGSAIIDLKAFEGNWINVKIVAIDKNIKVFVLNSQEPVLDIIDAFPIGKGGVEFINGSGEFLIDNLNIVKFTGGVTTFDPGEKPEVKKEDEAPFKYGEEIYENDFDNGTVGGFKSYENKSAVVDFDSKKVYHVKSYDNDETTYDWTDYSVEFDVNIDYGEKGTTWPAIFIRYASNGYRYDIYFESSNESIAVERHQGNDKKYIAGGSVKFFQNSGKWAHVKIDVFENTITLYYNDMDNPVFVMYDDAPISMGGIGFGDGGSQAYYVDNIVARRIEKNVPAPSLEKEEVKTDYDNSPYKSSINMLKALGFVKADDKGNFNPEEVLTRAEFASLIARIMKIDAANAEQLYSDVDKNHFAFSDIGAVTALGFMSGYGDGNFYPDDYVTSNQAAKVLMSALGYTLPAVAEGGYPEGYLNNAYKNGLFKGVGLEYDEELSREKAAKIISNALEIGIFAQVSYGSNPSYEHKKNDNLLNTVHNIYETKGILSANGRGGIYGEKLNSDEVMFDGEVYNVGSTDVAEQVGKYLNCYAYHDKKANKKTIVYYEIYENRFDTISVDADDIAPDTTLDRFEYYDEDGNFEELKISKNATILVNGSIADYSVDSIVPQVGKVTLTSTDNNGEYDLIMVDSYRTVVAGVISYADMKVYDNYKDGVYTDLSEIENLDVYKNGAKVEFADLKAGDVLSIAEAPDGNYAKILACDIKFDGTITRRLTNTADVIVIIDEKEYKYSKFYIELLDSNKEKEAEIGKDATYYLDIFGKIAFSKPSVSDDYMLIKNISYTKGVDGGWIIHALGSDGEWVVLSAADKFLLNDVMFSIDENLRDTALYTCDGSRESIEPIIQVALIKKNSRNKVKKIYTTVSNPPAEWPILEGKVHSGVEFIGASMSFSNRSFVDGKTKVFVIPSDVNDADKYEAKSGSYFRDGKGYSVTTYNENDYEVATIVLVDEGKASYNPEKLARPIIVSKFLNVLDSQGEVRVAMEGYEDSNIQTYTAENEKVFANVSKGDIVRIARDNYGDVVKCNSVYKVSSGRAYSNNPNQSMATDIATIKGDVVSYDAAQGRIKLKIGTQSLNGGQGVTDLTKAYMIPGAYSIYVYYYDRDQIYVGDTSDISPGDFVIFEYSWNTLRDIIIYKNMP